MPPPLQWKIARINNFNGKRTAGETSIDDFNELDLNNNDENIVNINVNGDALSEKNDLNDVYEIIKKSRLAKCVVDLNVEKISIQSNLPPAQVDFSTQIYAL